jgi:hypothetical protein
MRRIVAVLAVGVLGPVRVGRRRGRPVHERRRRRAAGAGPGTTTRPRCWRSVTSSARGSVPCS